MQIVIDVPEDRLNSIKRFGIKQNEVYMFEKAIINGTPLPKGHGRLIDADRFLESHDCFGYIEDMEVEYFNKVTPTIIPADESEVE